MLEFLLCVCGGGGGGGGVVRLKNTFIYGHEW